jgi:hypothetical protein
MEIFHLKINARASISTGKCTVHISNITEHRGLGLTADPVHLYDFHLGAWMGCDNPHMQYKMLQASPDGTGSASLSIPILPGDTDAFKIGCYIKDPDTKMNRHIASGFQMLSSLADAIDGVSCFDDAKSSLQLKDNYSTNKVLLHFSNNGTDVAKLRALCQRLKPSALRQTDQLNAKVNAMAVGIHDMIEKVSSVDTLNGGQNFVNNLCYTQLAGCMINYPLLNMTYDSSRHRTPLPMLSYMALATLHYAGLSSSAALALPDNEFIQKFVVPMCTSFTVCPESCVYSGDKTLDTCGNLQQATEDFAMVLSQHYYTDIKDAYCHLGDNLVDLSNTELSQHITRLRASPRANAKGHFLISDDCETMSGMIKSVDGGMHLASQVLAGGCDRKLGNMMWDCTRDLHNLASVPKEDFDACAQLLGRYGRLKANAYKGILPSAQIGLCIVSAKGASFSLGASELNGHACTVAQTLSADGKASYIIGEGTTNLRMRNLPEACPKKVSLLLTSKGHRVFDTSEALTIIGQNLTDLSSSGNGQIRIGTSIPCSFGDKDPYSECPFYMAGFFMGLEMGKNIPALIPLDSRCRDNNNKKTLAGEVKSVRPPLFGAPVAGLSCDSVRAIPVNLNAVMGETKATEFLTGLTNRNMESYPPMDSEAHLKYLMSRWGNIGQISKTCLDDDKHWILSSAEAFPCADMLRAVAEHKTRLGREFNALQSKDERSDGIQMHVKQHMMSVVTHLHIPLPERENWDLSCARNMRQALKTMPFIVSVSPLKSQFAL